ncbi:hypothetical protein Zm00014a_011844 [Zea mays]|uniref:Secreted protein n=1 Tax=Zea mays TaxID=4577 RepID=A0A3L6FBE0_MAIZE|nr:hypothetical protein Zm00014a_011844 [Zea mays]
MWLLSFSFLFLFLHSPLQLSSRPMGNLLGFRALCCLVVSSMSRVKWFFKPLRALTSLILVFILRSIFPC